MDYKKMLANPRTMILALLTFGAIGYFLYVQYSSVPDINDTASNIEDELVAAQEERMRQLQNIDGEDEEGIGVSGGGSEDDRAVFEAGNPTVQGTLLYYDEVPLGEKNYLVAVVRDANGRQYRVDLRGVMGLTTNRPAGWIEGGEVIVYGENVNGTVIRARAVR